MLAFKLENKVYPAYYDGALKAVTSPAEVYHNKVEVQVSETKLPRATDAHFDHPSYIPCKAFMLYSTINDVEDEKIFSGDIVEASIYADEKPQILEVRFERGAFVIDYVDADSDITTLDWFVGSLKIIGNIYEDSHLLEVD